MDEKQLQAYGQRIGAALSEWDVPEDFKLAFLELLPSLTIDQIDSLRESIEERVVEQTAIEQTSEYQASMVELNKAAIKDIDNLLADIK